MRCITIEMVKIVLYADLAAYSVIATLIERGKAEFDKLCNRNTSQFDQCIRSRSRGIKKIIAQCTCSFKWQNGSGSNRQQCGY